jgi:hypothetical protein
MIIRDRESPERAAARELVRIIAPKSCPAMDNILKTGDSENLFVLKTPLQETKIVCLENKVRDNPLCGNCALLYAVISLNPDEVEELS